MNHAITMGIFWHLIGAASAACFYAPFKKVKHWSWETMWSVGGIVSWLILPWAISATLLPDFWAYYRSFSASTLLPRQLNKTSLTRKMGVLLPTGFDRITAWSGRETAGIGI